MSAGWAPDPFGRHELRYNDGAGWTEHVSDAGNQSTDPAVPSTSTAGPTGLGTHTLGDEKVLWSGARQSTTSMATGGHLATAHYRLTRDAIHFDKGTLSTKSEMIPLWGVADVDVTVSMTQKARGVGDVRIHVDRQTADRFGQAVVPLQSVKDPYRVRDLILEQVAVVRQQLMNLQHAREMELRQAGASNLTVGPTPVAPAPAPAPAGPSVIEQLKDLAALKESGILTDEEFAAQKAKILGG